MLPFLDGYRLNVRDGKFVQVDSGTLIDQLLLRGGVEQNPGPTIGPRCQRSLADRRNQ